MVTPDKVKRKHCSVCKILKPITEFPPLKRGKHGVYSYCKPCRAEYQKRRNPNWIEIEEKRALALGLKKNGLKRCTSCKKIKVLDGFYGDPRHSDGKQTHCKECFLAERNAPYIMRQYGLTLEEFQKLMEAQDGRCAICGRPPKNNRFNIDHCHKTYRIRALLCVNCNTNLLPFVERFPEWVRKAFDYLEHPPAFLVIGERQVPETNQSRIDEMARLKKKQEKEKRQCSNPMNRKD